jgi:hypothetical protein
MRNKVYNFKAVSDGLENKKIRNQPVELTWRAWKIKKFYLKKFLCV